MGTTTFTDNYTKITDTKIYFDLKGEHMCRLGENIRDPVLGSLGSQREEIVVKGER